MKVSLRTSQLLVSRVCHDLSGGISAVRTGTELLSEEISVVDEAALDLMSMSARQAANRLQFLRVAFGLGGGQGSTPGISAHSLKTLLEDYFEGGRITLHWDGENLNFDLFVGKLILNMCLIASEALPRGGEVKVEIRQIDGKFGLIVAGVGKKAGVTLQMRNAICECEDEARLTPRTVNGYLTALLARKLGAEVEISPEHLDVFQMVARLPLDEFPT